MELKKYISKTLRLRLLLFFAAIGLAVLFDVYHEGSGRLINELENRSETVNMQNAQVFFYNPVNTFKLLSGTDKLFTGLIFAASQNDFLTKYHNCRTFYLLKAESVNEHPSFLFMAHFMKYNFCHHANPDDYPSVA
ncbi:hypothetical protein [Gaoshiqia sp. Z1-71]|uniref:hypothetical protein n=1 Tax=Gaoshiqia hydrogeniformans TaxID=3290090 RepID=UPI003BF8946B